MNKTQAALLSLTLLVCGVACGASSAPVEVPVPTRTKTAGETLLGSAPLGADLLLELDLKRLRSNPVVGSLLESVAPPESQHTADLLQQADVALLCVYDIGDVPKQLIVLRSDAERMPGAVSLGNRLYAVGDAQLLSRAEGLQSAEQSMAADRELLRLRAEVMPAKAEAATLRLVARLDFDARVSIASQIAISDVPVSVAVWGDVVDDLAVVAHLGSDEDADTPRLERAIGGLRTSLAKNALARALGLAAPLRNAQVTRSGKDVRVVLVLGPKRLQLFVRRLLRHLSNPTT